jgi:hypothetical protein
VKVHRYIIVFFLFAFIGQLSASYCFDKKSLLEWHDIDDDATDSEDVEEEFTLDAWDLSLWFTPGHTDQNLKIKAVWATPLFKRTELLISIDHPPEIA